MSRKQGKASAISRDVSAFLLDVSDEVPTDRFNAYFKEIRGSVTPEINRRLQQALHCMEKARDLIREVSGSPRPVAASAEPRAKGRRDNPQTGAPEDLGLVGPALRHLREPPAGVRSTKAKPS